MSAPASAAMSIAMSRCAARRSPARRAARGSGSPCCSTAVLPRGAAHGTPPRPPATLAARANASVAEGEIVSVLATMALACAAAA